MIQNESRLKVADNTVAFNSGIIELLFFGLITWYIVIFFIS